MNTLFNSISSSVKGGNYQNLIYGTLGANIRLKYSEKVMAGHDAQLITRFIPLRLSLYNLPAFFL